MAKNKETIDPAVHSHTTGKSPFKTLKRIEPVESIAYFKNLLNSGSTVLVTMSSAVVVYYKAHSHRESGSNSVLRSLRDGISGKKIGSTALL